ncbi:MAG: 6-phosphogluconolactonase [Bacteroidales bacterium]
MICCFPTVEKLSEGLSEEFLRTLSDLSSRQHVVSVALSGGTTPMAFFEQLAADSRNYRNPVHWDRLHFFFADERCVPPDHSDSNYGMANRSLFSRIGTFGFHTHRIYGENEPVQEAERYSSEISSVISPDEPIPQFDIIFLGIGEDGHTASIFPDRTDLLTANRICEAVFHPVTKQARITLTGNTLLNAKRIIFLVAGTSKSVLVKQIINREEAAKAYPAARIIWQSTRANIYLDKEAASHLNNSCRGKH